MSADDENLLSEYCYGFTKSLELIQRTPNAKVCFLINVTTFRNFSQKFKIHSVFYFERGNICSIEVNENQVLQQ